MDIFKVWITISSNISGFSKKILPNNKILDLNKLFFSETEKLGNILILSII